MSVAVALVELHVHASQSLKQKRGVLNSLKQRLRNRFNVTVAEVGGQGTWQRATVAIGAVGSDASELRGRLEKAIGFAEAQGLAEVVGQDIELMSLPFEMSEMSEPGDEDTSWPVDADEGDDED